MADISDLPVPSSGGADIADLSGGADIADLPVPSKKEEIRVGSLIYAKYKGKYIQHKVAAVDPKKGYKVTRKGHVNGWVKNVCSKIPNVKIVERTDVAEIVVN